MLSVIYWRWWDTIPEAASRIALEHYYYYWKRGEEDEPKGGLEWNNIQYWGSKMDMEDMLERITRALHKHRQCMRKRVADRTPVRGDTDIQMCRERWWSIGITLDIGDIFSAYYYRHTGYLISLSCLFAVDTMNEWTSVQHTFSRVVTNIRISISQSWNGMAEWSRNEVVHNLRHCCLGSMNERDEHRGVYREQGWLVLYL